MRPTGRWHLDEMVCNIGGRRMYLWRAVDDEGEFLDVIVQRRRDTEAALKLIKRLLRNQPAKLESITSDGLASYGAALDHLELRHLHRPSRLRDNNRVETRICRSDDGNGSNKGLNPKLQPRDFSLPTQRSTIPSISNVI